MNWPLTSRALTVFFLRLLRMILISMGQTVAAADDFWVI
jgi:hypothetical protein